MQKPAVVVLGVLCGALLPSLARAEPPRRYYDASGHYLGRSERQGDLVRSYDDQGRYTGRSEYDARGVRRDYDKQGRFVGESR